MLAVALLLLTFSPITIDAPIETGQFAVLLAGFVVLVALNLLLLRRVLSPLFQPTELMSSVEPDRPARRLSGVDLRSAEGEALAEAFNAMLDRLESARREAARPALAAQEAERLRVARELHDEIGQTLTAVTIQGESAAEGDPSLASAALRRVADAVRDSLDEVRRIARELRPEALDDLGLVNALIAVCTRLGAQDGPAVRRELQAKLPTLSPDVELVIYRIAQESLTNALRHSGARSATVSLVADGDALHLTVTDDGHGMPPRLPSGTAGSPGWGRALLVDGRLSIASRPDQGTEVRLSIPLGEEKPVTVPLKTRILLTDDQEVVRDGLRMVLDSAPDLAVVAVLLRGAQGRRLGLCAQVRREPGPDRGRRATTRGEPFLYPAAVRALVRDYLDRASRGEATSEDPLSPRELEVVN